MWEYLLFRALVVGGLSSSNSMQGEEPRLVLLATSWQPCKSSRWGLPRPEPSARLLARRVACCSSKLLRYRCLPMHLASALEPGQSLAFLCRLISGCSLCLLGGTRPAQAFAPCSHAFSVSHAPFLLQDPVMACWCWPLASDWGWLSKADSSKVSKQVQRTRIAEAPHCPV